MKLKCNMSLHVVKCSMNGLEAFTYSSIMSLYMIPFPSINVLITRGYKKIKE